MNQFLSSHPRRVVQNVSLGMLLWLRIQFASKIYLTNSHTPLDKSHAARPLPEFSLPAMMIRCRCPVVRLINSGHGRVLCWRMCCGIEGTSTSRSSCGMDGFAVSIAKLGNLSPSSSQPTNPFSLPMAIRKGTLSSSTGLYD